MNNNKVTVKSNSYILLEGNFEIKDVNGNITTANEKVYLCGCGKSEKKPFCDGSHKK
jgi:CDGSH-type Zn-finger protein